MPVVTSISCRSVLLSWLLAAAAFAAGPAQAEELARVLASVPIVQQVTVPRQVCTPQQIVTPAPKTGTGAVIGAVAGGLMGSLLGKGSSNRGVATAVGAVGGAVVGNQIEGSGQGQLQTVQQCGMQNFIEDQVTGYDVTYEYAGKQYTNRMNVEPGPYVRLQIVLVGGVNQAPGTVNLPATPTTYPIR